MKGVVFLLPSKNEEKAVGKVLDEIKEHYPKSNVVVVDNNSIDNTINIVRDYGCILLEEKNQGKGYAIRTGFKYILDNMDSKYIVMLDSDYTYDPQEAEKLVDSIKNSHYDIVLGSRLTGNVQEGAISKFNLFGNKVFTAISRLLYGVKVSDICTGYWVFTRESVEKLLEYPLMAEGFELETEMIVKSANIGLKIGEVPIDYRERIGNPSHLSALTDGWRILKLMFLYSPIALFLFPGGVLFLLGMFIVIGLLGGPINITGNLGLDIHPMIFGNLLVILGFQISIFGIFTKIFAVGHRLTRIDRITKLFLQYHSLKYELMAGLVLFAAGLSIGLWIVIDWMNNGFGMIMELRNAIFASTLMSIGIQIIFSALFINVLLLDKRA